MVFEFDLAFLSEESFGRLYDYVAELFDGSNNPTLHSVCLAIAEEKNRRSVGEPSVKSIEIAFEGVTAALLVEAVNLSAAAGRSAARRADFRLAAFFSELIETITKEVSRQGMPVPTIH